MKAQCPKGNYWWWGTVAFLTLAAVGFTLSLFFAHFSVALVLSTLLFALATLSLTNYCRSHPSELLNFLTLAFFLGGASVIQARISGVGIWEMLFYHSFGMAAIMAAALEDDYRQRKASS